MLGNYDSEIFLWETYLRLGMSLPGKIRKAVREPMKQTKSWKGVNGTTLKIGFNAGMYSIAICRINEITMETNNILFSDTPFQPRLKI